MHDYTVGFHFRVWFHLPGISDPSEIPNHDAQFREVSGISLEMEEETFTEGGENRFVHKLPVRAKYPDLVLKRGLLLDPTASVVSSWCQKAIQEYEIKPTLVQVSLLNEEHEPLRTFSFINAWPKKLNLSDFNAESSELVVETMELAYQYFTME